MTLKKIDVVIGPTNNLIPHLQKLLTSDWLFDCEIFLNAVQLIRVPKAKKKREREKILKNFNS